MYSAERGRVVAGSDDAAALRVAVGRVFSTWIMAAAVRNRSANIARDVVSRVSVVIYGSYRNEMNVCRERTLCYRRTPVRMRRTEIGAICLIALRNQTFLEHGVILNITSINETCAVCAHAATVVEEPRNWRHQTI